MDKRAVTFGTEVLGGGRMCSGVKVETSVFKVTQGPKAPWNGAFSGR